MLRFYNSGPLAVSNAMAFRLVVYFVEPLKNLNEKRSKISFYSFLLSYQTWLLVILAKLNRLKFENVRKAKMFGAFFSF